MSPDGPGDAVRRAMDAVPRDRFLRRAQRWRAGADRPLPIGQGQTNSQPATVEAMLRLLDVRGGDRVLDVGAGSGWTTALLAELAGPDGEVVGVELEPDLARWGAENLAAHLRARRDEPGAAAPARLLLADPEVLGHPGGAPYDRVLVSAMADALPDSLVDQLADGGVAVLPVQGRMLRVVAGAGGPHVTRHGAYRFVPLRGAGTSSAT